MRSRCVLLIIILFISMINAHPIRAQSSSEIDVAAVTLKPADVGQSGWAHLGAFVRSLESVAVDVAGYRGGTITPDTVARRLAEHGWSRSYIQMLGGPTSLDSTEPSQVIRSYVTEYADTRGAEAGFSFMEDESAVASATDVPLDRSLGDEIEATQDHGSSDGRPFRSLDITFRIGSLVAGVTVVNSQSRAFTDPDLTEATRLASILAERLREPGGSGVTLGASVLRFAGEDHTFITYDDAYYRLAGTDIPLVEEKDAAAVRIATYADATEVYQLWQGIDVEENGVLFGVTLLHFPNDQAATVWVEDLRQILDQNPFYGNLKEAAVPMIGDQAIGMTYVPGGADSGPAARIVAVRIGADVARVHLVPQGTHQDITADAVEELAEIQAFCLRTKSCPTMVDLPLALSNALAGLSGTPVASPIP